MIGRYEDGVINRLKAIRTVDNVDEIDCICANLEAFTKDIEKVLNTEVDYDNSYSVANTGQALLYALNNYIGGENK